MKLGKWSWIALSACIRRRFNKYLCGLVALCENKIYPGRCLWDYRLSALEISKKIENPNRYRDRDRDRIDMGLGHEKLLKEMVKN